MTTTFETAKVGDRVWSLTKGWGEIIGIVDDSAYPLSVKYDSTGYDTFTLDGRLSRNHVTQSFFWDEVVIDSPAKPMPVLQVDTKVLVWDNSREHARNAHFSHFENGKIRTFESGRTSFTKVLGANLKCWNYWELAE